MQDNELVSQLIKLSKVKYEYLQTIEELTLRQKKAIEEDRIDRLNNIILKKQKLIDKIDKLDSDFSNKFNELKKQTGVSKLSDLKQGTLLGAEELQQIVSKIVNLVKEILVVENENEIGIKNQMNQTKTGIQKINQGKKISNAYNPIVSKTQSYYFDKKK